MAAGSVPEWPDQTVPLQLVTFDDRGQGGPPQLQLQEKTRDKLLEVIGSSKVRAVAVCGVYRSGKSLLLNLLSGTQGKSSFVVGDTVRACTAGLWVRASKPSKDGSVCLLIDCEGSGNTERDKEHDARLFALAVLITSLLIFNSRGVISDAAVQALALAASLAQHIHRQNQTSEASQGSGGNSLTPAFLWVLRDFALALEDTSGNPITATEYLENMLTRFSNQSGPPPGTLDPASWAEKREAREKIMELFPQRDCATLVRPVDDEDDLQRLGEIPVDKMRPKFTGQIKQLREQVFAACPVLKSPTGEVATGAIFIALVQAYIEAMNSGSVPNLGDTWQHIQHQECSRAVEEGVRTFSAMTLDLASSLPVAADDLDQGLNRARGAAVLKFRDLCMGNEATRNEHEQELLETIGESMTRMKKENETVAVRKNEQWLTERWEKIEESLRNYRQMFDGDQLLIEECKDAEDELRKNLAELEEGYWNESVGSKEAYEEPFERLIKKRKEAALKEVANWKKAIQTASEAKKEAAEKKAREERKRVEDENAARNEKIRKDQEDAKKRPKTEDSAPDPKKKVAEAGKPGGKGPKCCALQ